MTSPPQTDLPDDDKITPDLLKIAGVVVIGAIMSILDVTVVNVALPTFQTDLRIRRRRARLLDRRLDRHGLHARARDGHPVDRLGR